MCPLIRPARIWHCPKGSSVEEPVLRSLNQGERCDGNTLHRLRLGGDISFTGLRLGLGRQEPPRLRRLLVLQRPDILGNDLVRLQEVGGDDRWRHSVGYDGVDAPDILFLDKDKHALDGARVIERDLYGRAVAGIIGLHRRNPEGGVHILNSQDRGQWVAALDVGLQGLAQVGEAALTRRIVLQRCEEIPYELGRIVQRRGLCGRGNRRRWLRSGWGGRLSRRPAARGKKQPSGEHQSQT
ncbi:MAG: hypothetical protein P8186_28455 [Anaerolineae bacterium]